MLSLTIGVLLNLTTVSYCKDDAYSVLFVVAAVITGLIFKRFQINARKIGRKVGWIGPDGVCCTFN